MTLGSFTTTSQGHHFFLLFLLSAHLIRTSFAKSPTFCNGLIGLLLTSFLDLHNSSKQARCLNVTSLMHHLLFLRAKNYIIGHLLLLEQLLRVQYFHHAALFCYFSSLALRVIVTHPNHSWKEFRCLITQS